MDGAGGGGGLQALERGRAIRRYVRLDTPYAQLLSEEDPVGGIVIDDENARASQRRGLGPRIEGTGEYALEPHGEPERAALSRLAVHPDLAAHQLHEAPADGETESGPAELARGRAVGLAEWLEQARSGLGRNSDAAITHGNAQLDIVGALLRHFDRNHHLAALRELDGVSDQVDEHLAEAAGIATQGGRDGRVDPRQELDVLELHPARFDLGEVEDLVENAQERAARAADRLRVLALLGGEGRVEEEPGHSQHTVHGRADLVAHHGQEIALGAGRLLRGDPGAMNLVLGLLARRDVDA